MANTRPRGLRRTKVIRDDDAAASELAMVFLEHPHWMSKIPLIVKDLKLVDIGIDADAIDRALGKLAHLAAEDRDLGGLYSLVHRLIKTAYPGARLHAVPETGGKSAGRIDSPALTKMANELERRIDAARQNGDQAPTPRSIVRDASFKRMFPVIGGTTRQPGRVTEDWARKQITQEMGRRAKASK